MLMCNYRKCRQPLKVCCVGTVCRHIFCPNHNPLQLKSMDGTVQCPACRTRLKENYDIIEIDLQPCEQYRTMILMGQSPETIFDICKRAVEFFVFQKAQELKYFEYINYKLEEKCRSMESQCRSLLSNLEQKNQKLQTEKDSLARECEELRDKIVASSHKLGKLEQELQYYNRDKQEQMKSTLNTSSDTLCLRSDHSANSSTGTVAKFPRCSPDSTYASPFDLRKRLMNFSFKKQLNDSDVNLVFDHGHRKSPSSLSVSNHLVNESLRSLSRSSTKTFFH